MRRYKLLALANVLVVVLNSIMLFAPKRPMSGVSSNAAGGLALVAIVLLSAWLIHIVLTLAGLYFRKVRLLVVLLLIMLPLTLLAAYWLLPLLQF